MFLLKKIALGIVAVFLIFAGSTGTQSTNIFTQGGGLVGIVIGLVVLYIFAKLIWQAMGCLPSLIVLAGIVFFLLYAIGAFNGGVDQVGPNLKNFFGIGKNAVNETITDIVEIQTLPASEEQPVKIGENLDNSDITTNQNPTQDASTNELVKTEPAAQATPAPERPMPIATQTPINEKSGLRGFFDKFFGNGKSEPRELKNFNPKDYPVVFGPVKVVSGDTMIMRNHYIRLYGIDAPEVGQTCADSRGRPYACGKEAILWLQEWIDNNEIECHALKQDANVNIVAVCNYGEYDIGAALVSAGWAISLPNNTVYKPYEEQAKRAHRGMWEGQFYKPWDWIKIQSRRPKIKIIKPRKKKMLWDYM